MSELLKIPDRAAVIEILNNFVKVQFNNSFMFYAMDSKVNELFKDYFDELDTVVNTEEYHTIVLNWKDYLKFGSCKCPYIDKKLLGKTIVDKLEALGYRLDDMLIFSQHNFYKSSMNSTALRSKKAIKNKKKFYANLKMYRFRNKSSLVNMLINSLNGSCLGIHYGLSFVSITELCKIYGKQEKLSNLEIEKQIKKLSIVMLKGTKDNFNHLMTYFHELAHSIQFKNYSVEEWNTTDVFPHSIMLEPFAEMFAYCCIILKIITLNDDNLLKNTVTRILNELNFHTKAYLNKYGNYTDMIKLLNLIKHKPNYFKKQFYQEVEVNNNRNNTDKIEKVINNKLFYKLSLFLEKFLTKQESELQKYKINFNKLFDKLYKIHKKRKHSYELCYKALQKLNNNNTLDNTTKKNNKQVETNHFLINLKTENDFNTYFKSLFNKQKLYDILTKGCDWNLKNLEACLIETENKEQLKEQMTEEETKFQNVGYFITNMPSSRIINKTINNFIKNKRFLRLPLIYYIRYFIYNLNNYRYETSNMSFQFFIKIIQDYKIPKEIKTNIQDYNKELNYTLKTMIDLLNSIKLTKTKQLYFKLSPNDLTYLLMDKFTNTMDQNLAWGIVSNLFKLTNFLNKKK